MSVILESDCGDCNSEKLLTELKKLCSDIPDLVQFEEVIKVTLTSAQLLSINTSPVDIIPAPGAGKIILVNKLFYKFDYQTTPYNTNAELRFRFGTSGANYINTNIILTATDSATKFSQVSGYFTADPDLANQENKKLQAIVPSGDPLDGDSDLTIWIYYQKLEFPS